MCGIFKLKALQIMLDNFQKSVVFVVVRLLLLVPVLSKEDERGAFHERWTTKRLLG